MKRAAMIVNPFASAVSEERLADVVSALDGVELEVLLTERPRHASELAAALGEVDTVLVYGGDGLLNEVLNGIRGDGPIGVLPGGRTNVVVRALGLPIDPVEAARAVLRSEPRWISLGRVNGRRFAFSAGIGFDAALVRRIDARGRSSDGRRPGDLAFSWEAAKLLASRGGRFDELLEVEGQGKAAFAFVANTDPYSYAAGRPIHAAPEARFELGLDLVAPRRVGPTTIPRLLRYAFGGGGQETDDEVIYVHDSDRIEIRCARPLPLHVDGEDLGDVGHAVFEAEREAVRVLAPRAGTLTA